jgi:[ribosomal protein S18]-alanine N-acetyltransferase
MAKITLPIRTAIAADVPAILELDQASATAAHYSKDQYLAILEPSTAPPAAAHDQEENRFALVLEEDSTVKGFLIGRFLGSEWEIENLVVREKFRKKSLGTALVNEFLNRASQNGAVNVFLEVRESNDAARRLYEKCKFEENARRKNYYRDPSEDAILYALRLR